MKNETWEEIFERMNNFCKNLVSYINVNSENGYFQKLQDSKEELEKKKEKEFLEQHQQTEDLEKHQEENTNEEISDTEEPKEEPPKELPKIEVPEDMKPKDVITEIFFKDKDKDYCTKDLIEMTSMPPRTIYDNVKALEIEGLIKCSRKEKKTQYYKYDE